MMWCVLHQLRDKLLDFRITKPQIKYYTRIKTKHTLSAAEYLYRLTTVDYILWELDPVGQRAQLRARPLILFIVKQWFNLRAHANCRLHRGPPRIFLSQKNTKPVRAARKNEITKPNNASTVVRGAVIVFLVMGLNLLKGTCVEGF